MKHSNFYSLLILILLHSFYAAGQSGHWEVLKIKNETPARSECGLAAVNGKLYLIGGDGSKAVESFDPITLQWTRLSNAPIDMHHFQAVSYNNRIYVLEAFAGGGFPDQVPMSNVYIYDPKNDTWQKGGEVPADRRRAGAGAVAYKDKLYLIAGIQHGHSSGTTNRFDVYDAKTGVWTQLPDAPHIRDHCSATVVNDKLYVVGGRNTSYHEPDNFMAFFSKTVLDVDCYDFKTGKWSVLPAKLPLGSGGGAVVNFNDVLYYIGGERATTTEQNASRKNTYYLDPSTQHQWIETDSLNNGRNGMAAVVLNNKIYVTGGSGGGPSGPPPGGKNNFSDSTNHNRMPPPFNANNISGKVKPSIEIFSLK